MKSELNRLFLSTLESLALEPVMRRKIRCADGALEVGGERFVLDDYRKVLIAAIGKAAHPMARAFAETISPKPYSGVVVSSVDLPAPRYFVGYVGGHPYPDAESFHAAAVVERVFSRMEPDFLAVYLLSGGGSAICERPVDEAISLEDSREFFRTLVTCGANIVEMNVLRKHFSRIKGGRLAAGAHPARQLTLYVSDVPSDQPSTVASGPTMPDESTVEDCYEIVERLGIRERLPEPIRAMFDERRIPETPKPGDAAFENSSWVCLLDNADALAAVRDDCERRGWVVETDLSVDDRPVGEAADVLLGRLRALREANPGRVVAVMTGGELSSPVTGDGMGGRNQAFVLDCVPKIAGERIAVVSAGTDGIDGNSPAAGALADGETAARAAALGMDPREYFLRSDSFHFFERLDDLLVTGPTGNNVRDVRLLVAW